jgi:hypothetical protein
VNSTTFVLTAAEKKPTRRSGRFFLRVGVARLVVRLLGIFVTLCRSLTLLARFLTTAVLLTRPLARRLIWLTGLILVRHGVSFHGSAPTTARSSGSFLTKKNAAHNGATFSA